MADGNKINWSGILLELKWKLRRNWVKSRNYAEERKSCECHLGSPFHSLRTMITLNKHSTNFTEMLQQKTQRNNTNENRKKKIKENKRKSKQIQISTTETWQTQTLMIPQSLLLSIQFHLIPITWNRLHHQPMGPCAEPGQVLDKFLHACLQYFSLPACLYLWFPCKIAKISPTLPMSLNSHPWFNRRFHRHTRLDLLAIMMKFMAIPKSSRWLPSQNLNASLSVVRLLTLWSSVHILYT